MADERAKFIKQLAKTIKTSTSAVERMEARKLFAKLVLGEGESSGDVAIDENGDVIVTPQPPAPVVYDQHPSQYDAAIQTMMAARPAGRELSCILQAIRVGRWMAGLWSDAQTGWLDHRTQTVLTFADAKTLIDERIRDLNLNSELVLAYPSSHSTIQEDKAFWNLPFEERLNHFRSRE